MQIFAPSQSRFDSLPYHISHTESMNVNIQASGQWLQYCEKVHLEYGITMPLRITLHSNMCWGSAYGMLDRAYKIRAVCCMRAIVTLLLMIPPSQSTSLSHLQTSSMDQSLPYDVKDGSSSTFHGRHLPWMSWNGCEFWMRKRFFL